MEHTFGFSVGYVLGLRKAIELMEKGEKKW
jgi:hypothetical protein